MTVLLEKAFAKASALPEAEQDLLATQLLAEMEAENAFDKAIALSSSKLVKLAEEALAENRAGKTMDLDPERL